MNLAVRRTPKPHVTIKYLEPDFTELFRKGLRGLAPDGTHDTGFAGREMARNAAVGDLALATGLAAAGVHAICCRGRSPRCRRRRRWSRSRSRFRPGVTKGRKFRTTWISYDALAAVHDYLQLDRAAATDGSAWRPPRRWGEPLQVTDPDARGGRINGVRRPWESLTPAERRRLVAPEGGSCLLAVKGDGGPFTAWATVFERTADRIRARFEPRFPHVHPHRLRHSFSMQTLEYLVTGHYRQAAKLVRDTDADAALVFYLSKADPLLVLRDLLGHSTVLTTEKYLRRLDTTRIYREAYETAGAAARADRRCRGRAGSRRRVRRRHRRGAADADEGDRDSARHLSCVFSDGSTSGVRPGRDAEPAAGAGSGRRAGGADPSARQCRRGRLGRPLRRGAARAWSRTLAEQGFTGGAADLRRGQLAEYWMAGPNGWRR